MRSESPLSQDGDDDREEHRGGSTMKRSNASRQRSRNERDYEKEDVIGEDVRKLLSQLYEYCHDVGIEIPKPGMSEKKALMALGGRRFTFPEKDKRGEASYWRLVKRLAESRLEKLAGM
jgi:hypothetical protein